MASISTLRAFPHTQVTLTIEATPDVAAVSTYADTSGYFAVNRHPAAAHDQADLSTAGTLLAKALRAPDVRWDRVTALRDAIATGTYEVPAAAVANKLIASLTV